MLTKHRKCTNNNVYSLIGPIERPNDKLKQIKYQIAKYNFSEYIKII